MDFLSKLRRSVLLLFAGEACASHGPGSVDTASLLVWQELVQEIKVLTGDKEKLKGYEDELQDLATKKKVGAAFLSRKHSALDLNVARAARRRPKTKMDMG